MRRIKFLTGAPEPRSLEWNDTVDEFLPAVRRFLEVSDPHTAPSPSYPKWRSIDIEREDSVLVELPESETQGDQQSTGGDFLNHSLAIFEGVQTNNQSHSHGDDYDASFGDTTIGSESFLTDETTSQPDTTNTSTCVSDHPIRLPSHVTNLEAIPKANYIQSIQPQTMTINAIVGVISLAPPRTVLLRRSSRTMDILELLVGDETNTAFSITFWLQPSSEGSDPLRQTLISLKPRAILVVNNIALTVFRGKVHGQSLNKRITRAETIVEVLGRDGQVRWKSLVAHGEQLEKVKRVEKWVLGFLCACDPPTEERLGKIRMGFSEELPPETQ